MLTIFSPTIKSDIYNLHGQVTIKTQYLDFPVFIKLIPLPSGFTTQVLCARCDQSCNKHQHDICKPYAGGEMMQRMNDMSGGLRNLARGPTVNGQHTI